MTELLLRVKLDNRFAYFLPPYPHEQLDQFFSYAKPSAYFNPLYHQIKGHDEKGNPIRAWDGRRHLMSKSGKVSIGLFLEQKEQIKEKYKIAFKIIDKRIAPLFRSVEKSSREWQNECLPVMQAHSNCGGLVMCGTGTGKTRMAAMYFKSLKGRAVFVVDELTLLDQAMHALSEAIGEEVGHIGDMKFEPRRITVATVQTLHIHRNDPRFAPWHKSLAVMIIDEVHEMLSRRNHDVVKNIEPLAVFGLTATLEKHKVSVNMEASALVGPLIFKYSYDEALKDKVLSPGIAISVNRVKESLGGYDHWDRYDLLHTDNKKYNNMVEELIREAYSRGYRIITLVHRVPHLLRLHRRLKDIHHAIAYGGVKKRDRLKAKRDFDNKKLRLIITNKVFKKGIDIKRINFIIDAADMPSWNDTQQKFGRGVRIFENKKGLIYLTLGYVNHDWVKKDTPLYNKFERYQRKRVKALKALKIKVYEKSWRSDAEEILDFAERKLNKVIRQIKRKEEKE